MIISKIVDMGGQDEFNSLMIVLYFNYYINTLASNWKVTLHMKIIPDFYENRYPIWLLQKPKILKFGTFGFGFGLRPKAEGF